MNNVMVDLETMGRPPCAPITNIGAVFFDPMTGHIGDKFYLRVGWSGPAAQPFENDPGTVKWWAQQSPEARTELYVEGRCDIGSALGRLASFLSLSSAPVEVWGNGDDFDCVLLDSMYKACGLPVPWDFWNTRDVRTVVAMVRALRNEDIKQRPFVGISHHALDDAVHQALYVCDGYRLLRS